MTLNIKKSRMFIVWVGLIILLFFLPLLLKNAYYQTLFNQALINLIVVLGLNFIIGLTGQMNLGTAGIMAIGAYLSALCSINYHISPWLCLVVAIGAGYLIGIGLGYPSLRVKGVYLALTTLGFGEIVRLMLTNLSNITGGTHGVTNIQGYNFFGFSISTPISFYYFLVVITIMMIFISSRIVNSKWGRAFKAIRDNVDAVEACGIDIADIKIKAFTLAAIYGSFAGALYAHLMGYINPAGFTSDLSFNFIVMMMVGGIGSVFGNIIGAILVTILPELLRFLKDYYWLVFSIIVLIFSIILPNGLVSLVPLIKNLFKLKTVRKAKGGEQIGNDSAIR